MPPLRPRPDTSTTDPTDGVLAALVVKVAFLSWVGGAYLAIDAGLCGLAAVLVWTVRTSDFETEE